MNFYKHHLGDYDGATSHLSWDEDMAYSRLMRVYYRREKAIPHAERYRLVRAVSKLQRAAVDRVLAEFFTRNKGLWRNKRCEEEIDAYLAQVTTNRLLAQRRWGMPMADDSHANRMPTVNESTTNLLPNQIPDTRYQNQILKPALDLANTVPTRVNGKVKTVLKKLPQGQNQDELEKNRRIAIALTNGNVKLAKAIQAGKA
jgi:uncharacterized protein YdaU (DUF1376 family)